MYNIKRLEHRKLAKAKKSLISVVIPTFNRLELLKRAVRSVVEQSYRPLEIVIVDDTSTEDLSPILEFHSNDVPIRLVRNAENLGNQLSRLAGVKASKGSHIAFLDSDDWWDQDKLRLQMDILKGNAGSFISCRLNVVHADTQACQPPRVIRKDESVLEYIYLHSGFLQSSTLLAEKRIMHDVLESLPPLGVHGDTRLFIAAQRAGIPIVQMQDPLAYFDNSPREDRVTYIRKSLELSLKWYELEKVKWSFAVRQGFRLQDISTRYFNLGAKWKAMWVALTAYHPCIPLRKWMRAVLYILLNEPPKEYFKRHFYQFQFLLNLVQSHYNKVFKHAATLNFRPNYGGANRLLPWRS